MHIPLPEGYPDEFPKVKSRLFVSNCLFLLIVLFYPVSDLFVTLSGILLLLTLYVTTVGLIEWMHRSFVAKAEYLIGDEFSFLKRLQYFTLILLTALILSAVIYFYAWQLVGQRPGFFNILIVFIPCIFLIAMSFFYDARLLYISDSLPAIVVMFTLNDRAIKVSLANLLFVIPVLSQEGKLQAFDKEGQVYLCPRISFEKVINEHQNHALNKSGNTWIDKAYWEKENLREGTFCTLGSMGGYTHVPSNELLMVVQKDKVYTLFTEEGMFYMPVFEPIKKSFTADVFEYDSHMAYRKGLKPAEIQERVFKKEMEATLKRM